MASTFTLPVPSAVTWPVLLALANAWLLVFQRVTALPSASGKGPTEPSEYVPYAVNCSVPPSPWCSRGVQISAHQGRHSHGRLAAEQPGRHTAWNIAEGRKDNTLIGSLSPRGDRLHRSSRGNRERPGVELVRSLPHRREGKIARRTPVGGVEEREPVVSVAVTEGYYGSAGAMSRRWPGATVARVVLV